MDAASWTVIAVGAAVLAAIAASFRSLRAEQRAHARRAHALAEDLRRRIDAQGEDVGLRIDAQGAELGQLRERLAGFDWTPAEDTAVRLADALDSGDGGCRLVELAPRLGRTSAAVRQRAARLRRVEVDGGERRRPEVLVRRLTQPAVRR